MQVTPVGIVTDYGLDDHCLIPVRDRKFLSTRQHPDCHEGTPGFIPHGCQ
jgi:hypothetical protein